MAFGWPDFGPLNQAAENIAMSKLSKWPQAARAPVREQTGGKSGWGAYTCLGAPTSLYMSGLGGREISEPREKGLFYHLNFRIRNYDYFTPFTPNRN